MRGKIFQVDPEARQFDLLKETAFDPKTREGRSRHTIHWTPETRFIRVGRQNNFEGLKGKRMARVRPLEKESLQASASAGRRSIVTLDVTLFAGNEDVSRRSAADGELMGLFAPDRQSENFREGTIEVGGEAVPVRLRGPRARVDVHSEGDEEMISEGFWEAQVFGEGTADGTFVLHQIDLYPRNDPRAGDVPGLPRVLVIGDSISMNYHRAAKHALEGIANYHRIDGNGGPSDRGVVCMELWLGDYTQEGTHWDVIQFNHGLHDLKQMYDTEKKEYGARIMPVEEYKKNLEREIQIMKKTGARLVWCTTTPVPQDSVGYWKEGTMGRQKDADLVYNRAAREVMDRHPDIVINDVNTFIRESDAFVEWRKQEDVHFWDETLQTLVGEAVADGLKRVIKEKEDILTKSLVDSPSR